MPSSYREVTIDDILEYHRALFLDRNETPAPLIFRDRLESAVARPYTTVFGEEAFPTLALKAAALLHGIVTGHPFLDGNKRAGLGGTLLLLGQNGVTTWPTPDEVVDLTLAVATGELREVEEIAARIRTLFALD